MLHTVSLQMKKTLTEQSRQQRKIKNLLKKKLIELKEQKKGKKMA